MYSLLQTIQRNLMTKKLPFQTLWSAFAWELWTGRKNIEIVQPVHYHSQRVQTFLFAKCSINDPPIADDLLHLKFLLIGIDCVDVNFIGRVVLQNVQRPSKTVRVLRNNVFCHLANNISVFGVLPSESFWHFLNGAYFLERCITMCSDQLGNVFFATSIKPRRSLWRNWPFWNWRRERSDAVQKRCRHLKEYSFHLNS